MNIASKVCEFASFQVFPLQNCTFFKVKLTHLLNSIHYFWFYWQVLKVDRKNLTSKVLEKLLPSDAIASLEKLATNASKNKQDNTMPGLWRTSSNSFAALGRSNTSTPFILHILSDPFVRSLSGWKTPLAFAPSSAKASWKKKFQWSRPSS